MSFFKNHDMLFVAPNENFSRIEDEFCNYVINRDVEGLKKFFKSAKHIYVTERSIYTSINTFTLGNVSQKEKDNSFHNLEKHASVQNVVHSDSDFTITTDSYTVIGSNLSKKFPWIKTLFPEISDNRRYGKCYELSTKLAEVLTTYGIQCDLVTAMVYGRTDKMNCLHSWVETRIDNEDFVLDSTLNACIKKDGYYRIQHAEPLSRISGETIKNDYELFAKLRKVQHFNLYEYLLFRDEIMKDLKKNFKMFDEYDGR